MHYGYARVSTKDQTVDLQTNALKEAGCEKVYMDVGISGSQVSRPQLDELLGKLSEGDTLTVWRLDRLGRSTVHLCTLTEDFRQRGISFQSLHEHIDTSSSAGKAFLGFMAVLAEFERDLIRDRVNAGIKAAQKRGKHCGRRRKLNRAQIAMARQMKDDGKPVGEILSVLRVSRMTLYRALKAAA